MWSPVCDVFTDDDSSSENQENKEKVDTQKECLCTRKGAFFRFLIIKNQLLYCNLGMQ